MKKAAHACGLVSAASFLVAIVSFIVWSHHFQLYSTDWDALLALAGLAVLVGVVSGLSAIALWLSR